MFIILRDGTGFLQCVLNGVLVGLIFLRDSGSKRIYSRFISATPMMPWSCRQKPRWPSMESFVPSPKDKALQDNKNWSRITTKWSDTHHPVVQIHCWTKSVKCLAFLPPLTLSSRVGVSSRCATGQPTHDAARRKRKAIVYHCHWSSNGTHLCLQTSKILRLRSIVTQCFRDHYFDRGYYEVKKRSSSFCLIPWWFTS